MLDIAYDCFCWTIILKTALFVPEGFTLPAGVFSPETYSASLVRIFSALGVRDPNAEYRAAST